MNFDTFSSEHFQYVKHECPAPNVRDIQVPDCPLCGAPVPGRRGEAPDVAVSEHIDNQCTSDPAKERRKKVICKLIYFGITITSQLSND